MEKIGPHMVALGGLGRNEWKYLSKWKDDEFQRTKQFVKNEYATNICWHCALFQGGIELSRKHPNTCNQLHHSGSSMWKHFYDIIMKSPMIFCWNVLFYKTVIVIINIRLLLQRSIYCMPMNALVDSISSSDSNWLSFWFNNNNNNNTQRTMLSSL